ncbi:unnamed protein product [Cyprideis torosa]|uniref:Uncharacterized protein n=1 Tax=Cyprideis torosa TaxID=163714 RepID=A0A7R8ZRT8_9CRUS|nr:unnamed protein product [Cyprideis torosa]CAG0894762.1 unnamed protein product [Cyprideis torosa]
MSGDDVDFCQASAYGRALKMGGLDTHEPTTSTNPPVCREVDAGWFMFLSVLADLLNRIPLRVQRRKGHTRETSKTERGVESKVLFPVTQVSPAHVELLATEQAHVSTLVNKANRSLLYALHHLMESKEEQEVPPAVPARTTYPPSVPARDGAPFQHPLSRSTPRPHYRSSEIPTAVTVEDISQVHATPSSLNLKTVAYKELMYNFEWNTQGIEALSFASCHLYPQRILSLMISFNLLNPS